MPGILSELLSGIGDFFRIILQMLGFASGTTGAIEEGKLRVFIKHPNAVAGVLPVDLDPSWSIHDVKQRIGPKLKLEPREIKIIFAGKELGDEIIIQDCNVGQQSFLHAVQIQVKQPQLPETTKRKEVEPSPDLSVPFFKNEIHQSSVEPQSDLHSSHDGDLSVPRSTTPVDNSSSVAPAAASKSNFYVYCNVCQELREGKLRVRCASCHSGAFIVLRDPVSWEDVLQPNRVPGSCETQDCNSNYSEFYFKCASHVTLGEDDSWPPLPQVKRNPDLVPCLACGEANDPMFIFDCTHTTCIPCFQQYSLLKLNERQFVQDSNIGYSLGCPALCQQSLIRDPHHLKLMGKYQYDRYQRFGAEEFVLQAGGILCPQPDCGMGIIPIETNCNKIACVHGCGFVFCRRCLEGWHMGECSREPSTIASGNPGTSSYPTITTEMAARAQWDDATRRTIKILTKPCPKCRVPTQRDGGCMHMECPKCSFNWCWVCQVQWSRECMGNHWFE